MIVSTQQLRTMFDELSRRIDALEFEVSFLKKGEKVSPPAKQPAPADPPPPAERNPQSLQRNSFTSHRWRKREKQVYG